MAIPYWYRQHDGFVFNGNHRISREEVKTINAHLSGYDYPPQKTWIVPDVEAHILMPAELSRDNVVESGRLEHLREQRLAVIQNLGEQMLQTAFEA